MLKGLFIARAGMIPRQHRLDVVANNLANINTIGYKKDELFFNKLIKAMAPGADGEVDTTDPLKEITDFSPGMLRKTDNPLDVAIVGEGFFTIRTEDGEVFTRNGNFTLDAEGRLITQDGHPVLGRNGEIQVSSGEVTITDNGTVMVNGEAVDQLKIVTFEDPTLLTKIGKTYFADSEDAGMITIPAEEVRVKPGYLEGSNVNGMDEMVLMIALYREFELGQRTIVTMDRTLDKLINDAGRSE